jgi:hypothetical protein
VNGTGANNHEQARILAVKDVADDLSVIADIFKRIAKQRQPGLESFRGNQRLIGGNVDVFGAGFSHEVAQHWRIFLYYTGHRRSGGT